MAGVLVVAGLVAVMAALLSTGDEVDQAPGTELVTPSLINIDPHDSPEAVRNTEATVTTATTPSLTNIDPHDSPEAVRNTEG